MTTNGPNKDSLATGSAVRYDGQHLIYENYKEPLKPIEKSKGYGFYGTIALTTDKAYMQCHICGHLFESVGLHLRKHKITGEKYREKFGLSMGTSLISETARRKHQERAVKSGYTTLPAHLKEYNRKVQSGEIRHKGSKHVKGGMSLEKRNKLGICPEQVLEKIKDLQDKLGHIPGYDEFREEHNGRYLSSIVYQHGSWSNAVRKIAGQTREDLRRLSKERLIEELQEFYKINKRIPMTSDFNRGMLRNRGAFISKFGSLNNARIEAGMNAVVPMPFGQIVELTPEEYMRYQEGHAVPGKRTKRMRMSKRKQIMEFPHDTNVLANHRG